MPDISDNVRAAMTQNDTQSDTAKLLKWAGREERKRRVMLPATIAASVALVLGVGATVIAASTPNSNGISQVANQQGVASNPISDGVIVSGPLSTSATSQLAGRGSDSALNISCGSRWTDPEPSAAVEVKVVWPASVSVATGAKVEATVTNIGAENIQGPPSWFVVILLDNRVVGTLSEGSLVGRSGPFNLAPGATFRNLAQIPHAVGCDASNAQPLPAGSDYEAVYVQRIGERVAYSARSHISVQE